MKERGETSLVWVKWVMSSVNTWTHLKLFPCSKRCHPISSWQKSNAWPAQNICHSVVRPSFSTWQPSPQLKYYSLHYMKNKPSTKSDTSYHSTTNLEISLSRFIMLKCVSSNTRFIFLTEGVKCTKQKGAQPLIVVTTCRCMFMLVYNIFFGLNDIP